MSRADVPIDAMPDTLHHRWLRVWTVSDHLDSAGMNWPTVPATCEWCREYRPYVAVSLLEGTFGTTPEHWPGRCPANDPKRETGTAWVGFETEGGGGPSPVGLGLLRAAGSALILGGAVAWLLMLLDGRNNEPWAWVATAAALGLGSGLGTIGKPKKKSTTKPKKG